MGLSSDHQVKDQERDDGRMDNWSSVRSKLVLVIFECVIRDLKLNLSVFFHSLRLIDYCLVLDTDVSIEKICLISVTCIFLASKLDSALQPELADLRNSFRLLVQRHLSSSLCPSLFRSEILDQEKFLLTQTLKWNMLTLSCHVDHLGRVLKKLYGDPQLRWTDERKLQFDQFNYSLLVLGSSDVRVIGLSPLLVSLVVTSITWSWCSIRDTNKIKWTDLSVMRDLCDDNGISLPSFLSFEARVILIELLLSPKNPEFRDAVLNHFQKTNPEKHNDELLFFSLDQLGLPHEPHEILSRMDQ